MRVPPQPPHPATSANLCSPLLELHTSPFSSLFYTWEGRVHNRSIARSACSPQQSSLGNLASACPTAALAHRSSRYTADEVPVDCSADMDHSQQCTAHSFDSPSQAEIGVLQLTCMQQTPALCALRWLKAGLAVPARRSQPLNA